MLKDYEGIRLALLEKYALDINNASRHFSTRNYAFVFDMDYCSVVLRVSPLELRMREEVLSEFMWIDDLKQFHTTVCQPYTSAKNKPIEEFEIGENKYRVTMFRRAEGKIVMADGWDNKYFYNVGRALGKLHKASASGYAQGFRYKRRNWYEKETFQFENFSYELSDEVIAIANDVKLQVLNFPQTPETYSMIHGDYWPGNFFTNNDDIWIFDFDDCSYGYFMFDIVTPISSWLQEPLFSPETKRHDLLYKSGMLHEFKRGYCENYTLPETMWDNFELFLKLRFIEQLAIMIPVNNDNMIKQIGYDMVELDKKIILAKSDFYEVLDEHVRKNK